jgi:hypothetical protein
MACLNPGKIRNIGLINPHIWHFHPILMTSIRISNFGIFGFRQKHQANSFGQHEPAAGSPDGIGAAHLQLKPS